MNDDMKMYIEPKVEVLPMEMLSALCGSGDEITSGGEGSQGDAMVPKRTPVF